MSVCLILFEELGSSSSPFLIQEVTGSGKALEEILYIYILLAKVDSEYNARTETMSKITQVM